MKAAVIPAKGESFVIEEREMPEPGSGEVRVAVEACGVCHSDALIRGGFLPGLTFPRIPGHEVAGRVDAVGEGVSRWSVGDRVGVGWHGGHCFECDHCRAGDFISCAGAKITGATHDGGYATAMVVPAESAARIPDDLDAVHAAPLLCAGVTTFNALRNAGLRAGATVAVQGIGGLGHLGLQFARRMGCRTIAISRGNDKKKLAEELGAHDFIDAKASDPAEALRELGGADIILATAPHGEAIESVFGGLSKRGRLLVVAATGESLSFPGFALLSGKSVAGWPSGTAADSEDTMRFAADQQVEAAIETFPLEEVNEAYDKMMANDVRFRAVLTMS